MVKYWLTEMALNVRFSSLHFGGIGRDLGRNEINHQSRSYMKIALKRPGAVESPGMTRIPYKLVVIFSSALLLLTSCGTPPGGGPTDGEKMMDGLSNWMFTGGGLFKAALKGNANRLCARWGRW
jgi:hypothetical protein